MTARPHGRGSSLVLAADQMVRESSVLTLLPSIVPPQPPLRLWLPTETWLATPDDIWALVWEAGVDSPRQNYQALLVAHPHRTVREHARATRTSFAFVLADGRIDFAEDFRGPGYQFDRVLGSERRYIAPYRSCELVDLEPIRVCGDCLVIECLGCKGAHRKVMHTPVAPRRPRASRRLRQGQRP